MATEAKNTNYWISSSALYIQLNAMGEPDYIQCSVVSGASILCYMQGIPGLEYDAGHNYQRWPLAAYPSVFPNSERKYIYVAIPRTSTADNNTAVVVYPSERIDLYGYSIANPDKLVGDERFYYIYLQGIISEVRTDADGKTRKRDWLQHVDCGKLNTDESLSSGIDGTWWKYNSVTDSISFLKTILSATFDTLTAKVAKITKLFLGGSELNGVADDLSLETDNTKVVTPLYLGQFGVKHFLAKDKDDVAHGTITFEKVQKFLAGLNVGDFNLENGGSWTPDAEGRSHLITDYLEVRMKAIFEELVIKKTSTIGGKEILSPAGGVVAHKVEEVTVTYNNVSQKAYRCYFLAEQEGDSVDNDFAIGDQVRSESFNVRKGTYHKVGNHFYWRLVIGRDEEPVELEGKKYHYIDLSDTDCATASDIPANGDVLNQCGNRTDVERQNCLIFSAVDTYSPSISLYHGINSYSFANKEYVEYGVNKQTNKAFFNVYGDMYVGDRPTKENGYEGSSYIKYDSAAKQVSIKGKLSAKSTVDGKELSQYIRENSAGGLTEEQVNNLIKNSQVIADLQNQVDGAIETWFYEGVPTLTNAPASSWTTDKDKDTHLGDLYYDNKTGKAYRFAKDGSTYKWTVITDTDIAKALSDASKAQETADGKMKVFSTQPIPPYQLGDIWVNATYPTDGSIYKNEILRCQTAKAKGSSFAIADWTKASKYTDDSALNTFKEEYKNDMASYKEQLDEKVETWFYNYAPTTQNKPASDWTTDTLKSQHAGDLFYNTSNGYTYRWTGTAWERIKDNDINTAMTAASKAQDTADGKRTVFTSQPTVPYDEGDLWASGGDDGKTLMVCVKSRTTGSFTSSEWVKANDSDLNAFAKTIEESLKGIRDQLDKKAETWYQATDPSTSWTTDDAKKEHKGDLWYNTSNNQTFFWNGTKWDKQDVPTEVFDKIDGKSSIYVSKPASYEERDLWILEAAYTLGDVAYSKGELVVATKSNASFSAADWTKKVKYTDDTVANAAKKAAEEAKKAADTAQTNIKELGKTVTTNKKAFDSYVTDGYLEPSEIAAMAQDSKRLEDAFAAAEKSYTEVKGAAVLKDTKELTDLTSAFTTLSTAKKELIEYLSDISARYNATDTKGKATIVSAVGTKFTNFQSAYASFYDKLGLANAYITSLIYTNLGVVIGDVATYQYLKKVLADGVDTEINGGLILTSLIALRDPETKYVESGINGVIDKTAKGNGIATWWGGYMNDGEVVGFDKKDDYSKQAATSLVRFDGSGYLANGAIWWGKDGKVHADPTSFIISEQNLGVYLTFFEPTWKAGSAGDNVKDLVSLTPAAPLTKLGVSGDASFEGAITFHGIKLTYDATNKAIKIDGNLYATGGITAYGAGTSTTGGGGGLNGSVKSYSDALKLTSESLSEIASAYSIKQLSTRISSLEGGSATSISVSGSGNAVTAISKNGTVISVTKGTTFLTSHQSLADYAKTSWVNTQLGNLAYFNAASFVENGIVKLSGKNLTDIILDFTHDHTFGEIIDKPTTLDGYGITDAYTKGEINGKVSSLSSRTTTLEGYFSSGSAKKALQLTNTRKLWGNSFDGTADISGSITVPNGKYISIGSIKLEYDATNKALKITNLTTDEVANLYTSGGITAYGAGTSTTGGGGLNGSVKSYSDALKLTSESLSEIASAYSIKQLSTRISSLEGGSATSISVSGSGNAVTAISKNGTVISVTKGTTFLTSHQSLADYAKTSWVNTQLGNLAYLNAASSVENGQVKLSGKNLTDIILDFTHDHTFGEILDKPTTIDGYGINDAYTKTEINGKVSSLNGSISTNAANIKTLSTRATTLEGYFSSGVAKSAAKVTHSISWSGYNSGSFDGSAAKSFVIPNNTNQLTNGAGFDTATSVNTKINNLAYFNAASFGENGIVKLSGHNVADISLDFTHEHTFAEIIDKPNTLDGYGIENAVLPGDRYFELGGIRITYDVTNKALKIAGNLYATGGITAYGAGTSATGGGGGLNGSVKSYSDALKLTSESLSEIASAYSIKQLSTRISSLEGGSATSISVSGSGNAVTAISKNGTVISVTKGTTFLTSHQSLADYAQTSWVNTQFANYAKTSWVNTQLGNLAYLNAASFVENGHVKLSGKNLTDIILDFTHDHTFGEILDKPTTLDGYGINDAYTKTEINGKVSSLSSSINSLSSRSSTLEGYFSSGVAKSAAKVTHSISWSGYSSGSYDGSAAKSFVIPSNTNQLTNGAGYDTATSVNTKINNLAYFNAASFVENSKIKLSGHNVTDVILDFTHDHTFSEIIDKPTTIDGYGITDAYTKTEINSKVSSLSSSISTNAGNISSNASKISSLTSRATTLESYFSSGSAKKALQLTNARTIWGQSFNGTGNVSGNLTGVDNITMSNNSYIYGKNTGGTAIQLLAMASWNSVDFGRGALVYGYTTQVMGKTVAITASDDSGKNVKSVELSTAKFYSNVTIETEGGLLAHGGVTAYQTSDERLKHDIHTINCLEIVRAMGGTVAFRYNADNSPSIGWIAQRVARNHLMSDIVCSDRKGFLRINYWSPKLIAVAFGAIGQVDDEVGRLKAKIVKLERQVKTLRKVVGM